ncbi:MAG: 16S rRNA processing protein RimM [Clostridia bacterium]|nr:16S rRNA processing protein RimM [Clostridia bacterium]
MIKRFLELGQIVGTHGVRGEMRVNPWCDSPEFMKGFARLYLDENGNEEVEVRACRSHGNVALLSLSGITTVEQAAAMRGRILYLRRDDARLPKGRFFISELIGCDVLDADDPALRYGTLSDVSKTGANDVWHVTNDAGQEFLLPAIPLVVIDTDVENNVVRIRPLKGIFDDAD